MANILKRCLTLFCMSSSFFLFTHGDDITHDVLGDIPIQYLPAAFGDFNADKLTDMFVIEKSRNGSYMVKVLLSHGMSPFLRSVTGYECQMNRNIKSVVPADFDGDGAMDVMVVSLQNEFYECYILWGNLRQMECPEKYVPVATLRTQPLLMDYNGDMIADLLGETTTGERFFWVFGSDRRTPPVQVPMGSLSDDPKPNESSLPLMTLSGGHAFVDVDRDLAADLWVSVQDHFELWVSRDDFESYEIVEYPLLQGKGNAKPAVIGQSAFFDIDMDGDIEVILPVCADLACAESFIYVHEFTNATDSEWHDLKVNLKDPDEVTWSFPSEKPQFLYTNTITLRVGDMNLDGYPDLLVTVFKGNTPRVIPMINSECKMDCQYPRTLVPQWKTFDAWPNSVMGTFFDFHEDGALDVLLVNASSDGKTYSMGVYKDSVQYDAMFLKVVVLTGACYSNCAHESIPYGTNQHGPFITYTMTSADGGVRRASATQLSQSGHFALQLPFSVLGLGRNWNFVDKLTIGIPTLRELPGGRTPAVRNVSNTRLEFGMSINAVLNPNLPVRSYTATFTQIIPNSQLVVIPYPLNRPSNWITKLFITPSKAMMMTGGALVATCLFVAAIIVILHMKEKQQDRKEKRQQAQGFHFDAM